MFNINRSNVLFLALSNSNAGPGLLSRFSFLHLFERSLSLELNIYAFSPLFVVPLHLLLGSFNMVVSISSGK